MKNNHMKEAPQDTVPSSTKSRIPMTISQKGSKYLMQALTNLYTRPEEAVFRETITNAYDSHRRASQSRPIEVTYSLSSGKRVLIVQDYGVGMSEEDIEHVYSKYGESTKQDNNSEAGFFGLGAKAGMGLAESVDIHAVKDGIATDARMFMDSSGAPYIDIVASAETSEVNSMRIELSLSRGSRLDQSYINKFFQTWKPGSVLMNGEQPYSLWSDANYVPLQGVGDDVIGWVSLPDEDSRNVYGSYYIQVAVGPVVYNVTPDEFRRYLGVSSERLRKICLNVPLGSVELTPPREGLLWSDVTITALKERYLDCLQALDSFYDYFIETLDEKEAFRFAQNNHEDIFYVKNAVSKLDTTEIFANVVNVKPDFRAPVMWRGKNFNSTVTFPEPKYSIYRSPAKIDQGNLVPTSSLQKKQEILMVEGSESFKDSWFRNNVLDFRNYLLEIEKVSANTNLDFLLMDALPENEWVEYWVDIVKKEDFLRKAKEYRASKKGKPVKVISYPLLSLDSNTAVMVTADEIPDDAFYVTNSEGLLFSFHSKGLIEELKKHMKSASSDSKAMSVHNYDWDALRHVLSHFNQKHVPVVVLHDRKPTALIKKKPKLRSVSDLLYGRFSNLSLNEQKFLGMKAFGMLGIVANDHYQLIRNCRALLPYKHHLQDEFFVKLVEFLAAGSSREDYMINRVTASNMFFWLRSDSYPDFTEEKMTGADRNMYAMAPLLMSPVWNVQHLIHYLNSLSDKSTVLPDVPADKGSNTDMVKLGNNAIPHDWGSFHYDRFER